MRPGMAFMVDGQLCICTVATHVTPGNLRAFVQAKLRRLSDGVIIEKRLRSTEEVEQAFLDRRDMEYLYSDKNAHVFMDTQTYDQLMVSDELLGDSIKYFKPNTPVTALTHEGNIVSLELPKVVELAVADTTPMPKGSTVTNQMKDATLEIGEVVRVNTDDGSYGGRAKG
jgi:elongation factor P